MIKVSKISKTYGSLKAVDDISFSLEKGKIYGFLGPNGAGKTTTMRIMTGYIKPDSGFVSYDKVKISKDNQSIYQILGYLPENNPLYENMRVDDFLLFVNELKNGSKDDLLHIAQDCGIEKVLNKEIGDLSKGYKQRVGLAKALIANPQYLILDEPSTGLDPIQKAEILTLIKKISKEKTILFSSHILSEVEEISNEVLIINEGKLVLQGTVNEVTSKNVGGEEYIVTTDAPSKDFVDKIQSMKDVTSIKKLTNEKLSKYSILTSKDQFGIEVFKLCSKNKWNINEMYVQRNTLENIFKKITK